MIRIILLIREANKLSDYAYIRVSTKEQNVDRQLVALEPFNLSANNIFCDYQSGKDFERPAYKKLIHQLKQGDLLIIKSIDRLGRNYDDILEQWKYITKEIGADIVVLDMSLLDTRTRDGNLTGTLISDIVLQLLAYVAQTEREFIKQRQAEGIAAAKAKGKRFGRKPIEIPESFYKFYAQWCEGKITIRDAAAKLGVSHSTFHRWCQHTQKKSENISEKSVSTGRHKDTST